MRGRFRQSTTAILEAALDKQIYSTLFNFATGCISVQYNACRLMLNVIYCCMIRSFRDRETRRIFQRIRSRKLPNDIQQTALRKLRMLNRSTTLADLRVPPANRLEKLRGDRAGQYSIRINDQWRICFTWQNGDAYNVEIVDYH